MHNHDSLQYREPKRIESWEKWLIKVVSAVNPEETDLWDMHDSGDYTANEAIAYIKKEQGL